MCSNNNKKKQQQQLNGKPRPRKSCCTAVWCMSTCISFTSLTAIVFISLLVLPAAYTSIHYAKGEYSKYKQTHIPDYDHLEAERLKCMFTDFSKIDEKYRDKAQASCLRYTDVKPVVKEEHIAIIESEASVVYGEALISKFMNLTIDRFGSVIYHFVCHEHQCSHWLHHIGEDVSQNLLWILASIVIIMLCIVYLSWKCQRSYEHRDQMRYETNEVNYLADETRQKAASLAHKLTSDDILAFATGSRNNQQKVKVLTTDPNSHDLPDIPNKPPPASRGNHNNNSSTGWDNLYPPSYLSTTSSSSDSNKED